VRRELLMPKLGLTMTEGTLIEWAVAPGARFEAGQTLFVVESDKVATEVEAEADGTLVEAALPEGETVEVGTVIGYWEAADEASGRPAGSGAATGAARPAATPAQGRGPAAAAADRSPASAAATPAPVPPGLQPRRRVSTPYARRRARELGVDLAAVAGTGPRGRIQARDVEGAPRQEREPSRIAGRVAPIRPTATQQTMARRLVAAKQQIPHFYLAIEAEVSALLALRAEFNARPGAPKLTVNHLLLAAVGRALRAMPQANRVWTDEGIVAFDRSDVGIAVDTDRGLLVPVLRDAGGLARADVARGAADLVERARAGTIAADEMSGGAITVSNAGMLNVTYMTPIINPGQAMILGVGSVRDLFRPDAQGRPAHRREVGLVLAVDHRILSGAPALRFLNAIVRWLERPAWLLADPAS
jgi:pyruvate dehydrogenase E2 component (dihydrolipoamide acetyltransferase)